MDITGISANGAVNAALAQKETQAQADVATTMLKKNIDMNKEAALSLIQTLPQPGKGLPANLGNQVNTTA